MGETWHITSTYQVYLYINSFGHFRLILGQRMAHFSAPRTAVLAVFRIIEGILILFKYPKWMTHGILHQLFWLKKKTVSDSSNSFLGQKMANFALKNGVFGLFWDDWRQFGGQKWPIFSPKMRWECRIVFFFLSDLGVDVIFQVSSILDIR